MPTGYASIAEANTYLSGIDDWVSATGTQKQRSLDAGRIAMDDAFDWDDDVTPGNEDDVKDANCELALADVRGQLYPDRGSPVVEAEELGPLKRKFRSSGISGREHLFTRFPKVLALISSYGIVKGRTNRLLRS